MAAADQMGMTAGTHTLRIMAPRPHLSSRSTCGLERSTTIRLAIRVQHRSQQKRLHRAPSKDTRGASSTLAMRRGLTLPSVATLMAQLVKIANHTM